jgi:radial spoke head protein 9
MNELHNKIKSEELLFWGKIIGLEADYYIAQAINYTGFYEFPQKAFYWAVSTKFAFEPLPESQPSHDTDLKSHSSTYFKGVPGDILVKYESEEDEQPVEMEAVNDGLRRDEDGNIIEKDPLEDTIELEVKVVEKKKNFTELCKLAIIVRNIDYDTSIVPQGAFKIISMHEMRRNETFRGLSENQLKDLSLYQHFRPISDPKKKEIVESDESIFRFDFLDSIANDRVVGSWSAQLDSTKQIVNLRSLLWPGYFAIHKANSSLYFGVYIGEGIRNAELAFTI